MNRLWVALVAIMGIALAGCPDSDSSSDPLASLPEIGTYGDREVERVFFEDLERFMEFTEGLGYGPEALKSVSEDVPRIVLLRIPAYLSAPEKFGLQVARKKRLFFRSILPMFLIANEEALADRAELTRLEKKLKDQRLPDADSLQALRTLATKYRLETGDTFPIDKVVKQLKLRVDIVPPSLGLAQAAEESGWGSSRFVREGNALFGQWTFSGKGIEPKDPRKELGDYKVAAFDTPMDSVRSYLRNLNTNPAYKDFRARRAKIRAAGTAYSGAELVGYLKRYSERGADYIHDIRSIIRANRLERVNKAVLADGRVYELVPLVRLEG